MQFNWKMMWMINKKVLWYTKYESVVHVCVYAKKKRWGMFAVCPSQQKGLQSIWSAVRWTCSGICLLPINIFGTVSKTTVAIWKGVCKLFLFLIYFIKEMASRCTADVVFWDADEPFGAMQLIMSSVYCYKIGLPGNNHYKPD